MAKARVEVDGETKEVDLSSIDLPENHDVVTPDNASSKGYFTQAQLDQKIENRLSREDKKLKKQLKKDEQFLQEAANHQWGISFDEEGKPQGLKPEVDIEKVKRETAESLESEYEEKLQNTKSKASTYKDRLIEQSILSATKGDWKETYTKYQDDGRVKPMAVKQYKDLWDIDDNGDVALLDKSGEGFAVNAKGQHIHPDDYLTDRDKFGDYMHDNRQKGSGFGGGAGNANGKRVYTEAEVNAMSEKEYAENRDEIKKAMAEGRVQ